MTDQFYTPNSGLQPDSKAFKAIQKIQTWVNQHHPILAASAKSRMVLECLIEIREENKMRFNNHNSTGYFSPDLN